MLGRKTHDDTDQTTATDTRGRYDDDTHVADHRDTSDSAPAVDGEQLRRDRFGGINWGAGFFGWLVAIAVSLLLAGIVGALTAGTEADEQLIPDASTTQLGLAAALTVSVILAIGYYAGGYVAGRMSRFDGLRQGLAVWLVGVVLTAAAVAAGTFFGDQYNVLSNVNLPSVPTSTETLTTTGLVLGAVVLLVTLVTSMLGGGVGRHYHARVDRAGW